MEQKLTLSQLNQCIKETLNKVFPGKVWVVAEISEMKENRSGHCYLELVERQDNDTIARARAIIWSYTYRMLKPYFESSTGHLFSGGLKILVEVTVEFHPVYGLSLNIKDIEPAFTIGDMALQRKEIIDRLKAENVFYMNKELSLPLVPQRIAVISSGTAAGYQDFINHLKNNSYGFKFYTHLFQAYMQGSDAVYSIIKALECIFKYEKYFDAVVIIRGGGAVADLGCFDNYELALNITQFPLPVITGIGHEKDDTIIDLVAHTRLKTPTAVAEFFISGAERFYEILKNLNEEVAHAATMNIELKNDRLKSYADSINRDVYNYMGKNRSYLIKYVNMLQKMVSRYSYHKYYELNNLKYEMNKIISGWSVYRKKEINRYIRKLSDVFYDIFQKELAGIARYKEILKYQSMRILTIEQERVHLNQKALRLLDPARILRRGYTLTLREGKIIKSASSLELNDEIETRFKDGKVKSKITKKI